MPAHTGVDEGVRRNQAGFRNRGGKRHVLGFQAQAFTASLEQRAQHVAQDRDAERHDAGDRTLQAAPDDEAARITTDCLFLAVILVTLLAVLGALTIEPLFTLLGASAELISLIHDYMLIWYLTVPMLVIPMVGNAAIRTTGDTKTPSLVMGVAGLVNGVLDPLLIFGPGPFPEWGIRGAAIATSLSWLMAMLVSLHILRQREQLLSWRLSPRPQRLAHWRALLQVAVPASFTNMLNPLASTSRSTKLPEVSWPK